MEFRTYQASTMAAALAEIKRELGRDAVIVRTRCVRKGGLLGLLGGRRLWEVKAATQDAAERERLRVGYCFETGEDDVVEDGFRVGRDDALDEDALLEGAPRPDEPEAFANDGVDDTGDQTCASHAPSEPEPTSAMAAQMRQIQDMVQSLIERSDGEPGDEPSVVRDLRLHLLDQDVSPQVAVKLLSELRMSCVNQELLDEEVLRDRLVDLIASRIRIADNPVGPVQRNGRPRVVALIGPTGVGKTTTIAKMAANLKLRHEAAVGLITLDTYRIAAVEQLRTYAEIIEVPIETVLTPGELHRAVRQMNDVDVVLIDTAGRSQNDTKRLAELQQFVAAADADEVHLVVSASSSPRVTEAAIRRFAPLGANRVIISKLDEAETFGMILNVTSATDAAVSFVTTGQDVPADICTAEAEPLARSIVEGRWDDR